MSVREDINKVEKKIKRVEEQSLAMELLSDYKKINEKINKRQFITILVILVLWFASIGMFIYYINTTGYEVVTESADTGEGGNACVGDNCNNGVINGKSN